MIHRRRASVFQLRNTTSGTSRTSIVLFKAMKNGTVGLISAESAAYVVDGSRSTDQNRRISIDEQCPHPMRRKNLREVRTPGAERVLGQLGLPLTPKDGGQDNRQSLADEVGPYGPDRRASWVIPNERNAATKR